MTRRTKKPQQQPKVWLLALAVPCPQCGAKKNQTCQRNGHRAAVGLGEEPHAVRRYAARKARGE